MRRYDFQPIAGVPLDGQTLILADDSGWMAAGHWVSDMWALGHADEHRIEQLDFEPTKFALPQRRRKAPAHD
jgi:hypothetical protein